MASAASVTEAPAGRLMTPEIVRGGKRWYVVELRMCGLLADGPYDCREAAEAAVANARRQIAA